MSGRDISGRLHRDPYDYLDDYRQSTRFIGVYSTDQIPSNPKLGDRFITEDGEKGFVFTGTIWAETGSISSEQPSPDRARKKHVNCPNCGAPSPDGDRCEYCGTFLLYD